MKLLQISNFLTILFILANYVSLSPMENQQSTKNSNQKSEDFKGYLSVKGMNGEIKLPSELIAMCGTLSNFVADHSGYSAKEIFLDFEIFYLKILKKCLRLIYLQTQKEKIYKANYTGFDKILRADGVYILKNVHHLLQPLFNEMTCAQLAQFINMVDFLEIGTENNNDFLTEVCINIFVKKLVAEKNIDLTQVSFTTADCQITQLFIKDLEEQYGIFSTPLQELCIKYLILTKIGAETAYSMGDCITLENIQRSKQYGLHTIDCSNKKITDIEGAHLIRDSIYITPHKIIESINLSNNLIINLKKNAFNDFEKLCSLNLSGNYIATVALDYFATQPLRDINLNRNQIECIEPHSLDHKTLKELLLWGNRIQVISAEMFTGLPKLTYLALPANDIEEVERNVTVSDFLLPELKCIELSSNAYPFMIAEKLLAMLKNDRLKMVDEVRIRKDDGEGASYNDLDSDALYEQDCQGWVNLQCTDAIVQFPLYLLNMSVTLKNMVAGDQELINNNDQSIGLEYSSTYLNLLKEILSIIYKQTKIEKAYKYNYQSPDRILRQDRKYIIKNVKKLLANKLPAEHQIPTTIKGLQGFINIVNFLDVGCAQDNAFLLEILISAFIGKLLEFHTDKEWAKQEKLTAQVLEDFRNFIHDNYFNSKQLLALCVEYKLQVFIKYDIADCMTLEGIKVSQDSQGLTKIDLTKRGITSLDGIEILKDKGIQSIDLSFNCITTIKNNQLAQLILLEELLCIRNDIYTVDANKLNHPNLKKLNLSHNKVSEISTDTFKQLPMLKELNLGWNRITSIKPDGLTNKSMKNLILASNPLSLLTAGSFSNLPQLEEINFNFIPMEKIKKETFISQDLPCIRILQYSNDNWMKIAEKIATQLQKTITLRRNFSASVEIKPLPLNNIKIQPNSGEEFKLPLFLVEISQTLTNMLEDCPQLINDENASLPLEFSESQLRLLKKCLKLIHNQSKRDNVAKKHFIMRPDGKYIQKSIIALLEDILKNMPIKEFTDFINMIHFFDIGVDKNNGFLVEAVMALFIKFLPPDEIKLKNVYDPVDPSPEVISELKELIKEKFFVVEPLIDLFIEYYGMYRQKIPCKYSIGDCITLEDPRLVRVYFGVEQILNLGYKKITDVDGIDLISNKTVDIINLNNNYIKAIPKNSFVGFTSLKTLDLVNNKLDTTEPSCFANSTLQSLYLNDNPLKKLDSFTLAGLPKLSLLELKSLQNNNGSISLDSRTFSRQDLPSLRKVRISNIANKSVIIQLEKLATQLNRSFKVSDGISKDIVEPKMVYNLENSLDKCMIQ